MSCIFVCPITKKTLKNYITVCSGDTINEIFIQTNLNLPKLDVFCGN